MASELLRNHFFVPKSLVVFLNTAQSNDLLRPVVWRVVSNRGIVKDKATRLLLLCVFVLEADLDFLEHGFVNG